MPGSADQPAEAHSFRNAYLWALAVTILWPVTEVIGGPLIRGHGPMQTVWFRYTAHLVFLGVAVIALRRPRPFHTRRPVLQILRGLLMFLMPAGFVLASSRAGFSWIWTIFWILPLLSMGSARVLLGERLSRGHWIIAALGFGGVVLILRPEVGGPGGTLAALLTSVPVAGYFVVTRLLQREQISASLFYTALGAVIPVTLVLPEVPVPAYTTQWVLVFALGLTGLFLLVGLDRAFEQVEVGRVVPVLYGVVLVEAILMDGIPDPPAAVGMGLIVAGILAIPVLDRRRLGARPR